VCALLLPIIACNFFFFFFFWNLQNENVCNFYEDEL
jgi:hypothetical protein